MVPISLRVGHVESSPYPKAAATSVYMSMIDSTKKICNKLLQGAAAGTVTWITNVGNESVLTQSEDIQRLVNGMMD